MVQPRSWLRPHLLLALVVAAQLFNSALVILDDHGAEGSDGADYYTWSVAVARDLRGGEVFRALDRLLGNDQRAPLGVLPAVVAQAVGGPDPALSRLANLAWLPLMLWSVFCIGARLDSRRAGLLSAALAASYPMILGFSRLLWLDFALTTMACLTVQALLRPGCFSGWRASLLLGLAAGLGMLVKPAVLIYVGPPALGVLLVRWRQQGWRLRAPAMAAVAGLTALAVFSVWGARHLAVVLLSATKAQGTGVGAEETRVAFDLARIHGYVRDLPTSSLGPLFAALAVLGLVALVARDRRRAVLVTTLWFGGSLLLLGLFVEWSRYLMPALPALALITGCGLRRMYLGAWRPPWVLPAACAALCLLTVQQSWFGPSMVRCQRDPDPARGRIFCHGMVRAVPGVGGRPDLSALASRSYGEGTLAGVVPNALAPEPAPPPYNMISEAFGQWLVTDLPEPPWPGILRNLGNRKPQVINGLRLVAIVEPGAGYSVPHEERASWRRVRQMIRADARRWKLVKDHRFADGTRLRVYHNLRPRALPPPSDTVVW